MIPNTADSTPTQPVSVLPPTTLLLSFTTGAAWPPLGFAPRTRRLASLIAFHLGGLELLNLSACLRVDPE